MSAVRGRCGSLKSVLQLPVSVVSVTGFPAVRWELHSLHPELWSPSPSQGLCLLRLLLLWEGSQWNSLKVLPGLAGPVSWVHPPPAHLASFPKHIFNGKVNNSSQLSTSTFFFCFHLLKGILPPGRAAWPWRLCGHAGQLNPGDLQVWPKAGMADGSMVWLLLMTPAHAWCLLASLFCLSRPGLLLPMAPDTPPGNLCRALVFSH